MLCTGSNLLIEQENRCIATLNVRGTDYFSKVNIMVADALETQGASPSAMMILAIRIERVKTTSKKKGAQGCLAKIKHYWT